MDDGRNKGSNAGSFKEGIPLARYGVSACNCFKTHLSYSDKLFVLGHDVTPGAENIDCMRRELTQLRHCSSDPQGEQYKPDQHHPVDNPACVDAVAVAKIDTRHMHMHVTVHAACIHPPELREYPKYCNRDISNDANAVLFAMSKDEDAVVRICMQKIDTKLHTKITIPMLENVNKDFQILGQGYDLRIDRYGAFPPMWHLKSETYLVENSLLDHSPKFLKDSPQLYYFLRAYSAIFIVFLFTSTNVPSFEFFSSYHGTRSEFPEIAFTRRADGSSAAQKCTFHHPLPSVFSTLIPRSFDPPNRSVTFETADAEDGEPSLISQLFRTQRDSLENLTLRPDHTRFHQIYCSNGTAKRFAYAAAVKI
ncbi:hypothetical protein G5I_03430 [Acromyrmex echinatior]|uniref:Uncharacterized protein n=1 Tax=Acromyrmex echinatior TaxID=103372 RepID=F4WCZ5_ACREC|nr:hypothetical protein G5I_03430 [Acromyrmex echinatior]